MQTHDASLARDARRIIVVAIWVDTLVGLAKVVAGVPGGRPRWWPTASTPSPT